jgi:hypothetical protein
MARNGAASALEKQVTKMSELDPVSASQDRSFAEHRMRVDFEFPNHLLAAICGISITLHQKVID